MAKVTDIINTNENFSYSIEVVPGKEDKINSLDFAPKFYSVTWHAKPEQWDNLDTPTLQCVRKLRSENKTILLHLPCTLLRKSYLEMLLKMLQEIGVNNLFVIRGENYDHSTSDFQSTLDLIAYIRQVTDNYFCIGVAGFPTEDESAIQILVDKSKQADFIVTQAFFEAEIYKQFVNKCKERKIEKPIVPGIMLFQNSAELERFANLCKIKIDANLSDRIKQLEVEGKSASLVVKDLVDNLKTSNSVKHFHFFALYNEINNFIRQCL